MSDPDLRHARIRITLTPPLTMVAQDADGDDRLLCGAKVEGPDCIDFDDCGWFEGEPARVEDIAARIGQPNSTYAGCPIYRFEVCMTVTTYLAPINPEIPQMFDPAYYVREFAADGRTTTWSDYASEGDALAVFNGEEGPPLFESVRIEMGSITDDGGFEPTRSRSLISAGFVDVSNIQEYGLTQKLSNSIRCF